MTGGCKTFGYTCRHASQAPTRPDHDLRPAGRVNRPAWASCSAEMSSTFSRRSLARYATPAGLLLFASADSRCSLQEGILASAPARVIAVGWAAHRLVKKLDRDGASRRTCSTLVW